MKKTIILTSLYLLVQIGLYAQNWKVLGPQAMYTGIIHSIFSDNMGNVYASESQNAYGRCFIGKYNGNAWSVVGGTNSLNIADSIISSVCADKMGNIYAAANFKSSTSNNYILKWNGSSWSQLGNFSSVNPISCICLDSSGNLYAAGFFTNRDGKYYVAKWDGTSWSELGGTNALAANGYINVICMDSSGYLYAAGNFTNDSGSYYVAKWNGSTWRELGGENSFKANGNILAICTDKHGNVFTSGNFTDSKGHYYIMKWDGSNWSGLYDSSSFPNVVYQPFNAICVDNNGYLYRSYNGYVPGIYQNSTGIQKWGVNYWNEVLQVSPYKQILSLVADASGNLYTGGTFVNGDGFPFVYTYNSNTVTPLQLINFSAITKSDKVLLQWQSSDEINTVYFIIQGSTDGSSFTDIGNLSAFGSGANNYHFTDALPINGICYYRLKMVDKDASYRFSKVVSVIFNTNASLRLYPNPANVALQVALQSEKVEKGILQILDIGGKLVLQEKIQLQVGSNSFSVNTSSLPKGSYTLRVRGTQTIQQKFAKE